MILKYLETHLKDQNHYFYLIGFKKGLLQSISLVPNLKSQVLQCFKSHFEVPINCLKVWIFYILDSKLFWKNIRLISSLIPVHRLFNDLPMLFQETFWNTLFYLYIIWFHLFTDFQLISIKTCLADRRMWNSNSIVIHFYGIQNCISERFVKDFIKCFELYHLKKGFSFENSHSW